MTVKDFLTKSRTKKTMAVSETILSSSLAALFMFCVAALVNSFVRPVADPTFSGYFFYGLTLLIYLVCGIRVLQVFIKYEIKRYMNNMMNSVLSGLFDALSNAQEKNNDSSHE